MGQIQHTQWDVGHWDVQDYRADRTSIKKKRKVHARWSYHYKIGQYQLSPYSIIFLSDTIIQIPGASNNTVRNQTKQLSLNPKSAFSSWFKMPLYKVETLAAQLVEAEVIHLSHYCRTVASLKIKSELLVLGALAIFFPEQSMAPATYH